MRSPKRLNIACDWLRHQPQREGRGFLASPPIPGRGEFAPPPMRSEVHGAYVSAPTLLLPRVKANAVLGSPHPLARDAEGAPRLTPMSLPQIVRNTGGQVAEMRAVARPQLHVGRSAAVARRGRFAGDGSPTYVFRWWSFERSDEVGGDPATVEVARLRSHPLVAHPCDIHAAGIARDVIAQRFIGRRRVAIGPRDCMHAATVGDRVEVARRLWIHSRSMARDWRPAGRRARRRTARTRSVNDWSRVRGVHASSRRAPHRSKRMRRRHDVTAGGRGYPDTFHV